MSVAHRKTALVMGVANGRSVAWACVESLLQNDYNVVCTYRDDRFRSAVERLITDQKKKQQAASEGRHDPPFLHALPCNITTDLPLVFRGQLPELLSNVHSSASVPPSLDAIVHSIAYAPPESMKEGSLLQTSREDFLQAHEISAYSFLELARESLTLLTASPTTSSSLSSLTALSYLGATRAVQNYNVMGPAKASLEAIVRGLALELGSGRDSAGVRVNCVSAGPLNTLAARGIQGFSDMRQDMEERAPLKRNVTAQEVADTVTFLASASGITGQTYHVDGGYNNVAGPAMK